MINVIKHIIEAYIIHRTFCPGVKPPEQAEGCMYQCLNYSTHAECRVLKPMSTVKCYDKINTSKAGSSIEMFLSELYIQKCDNADVRGCTWIELYILYKLRGGNYVFSDPTSKLAKRATADKRINYFKKLIRAIVDRTLIQDDKELFKPGKMVNNSMKGVGLLGKTPTVSFNISISMQEQQAIAVAISSLIRTAPMKKHKDYVNGICHMNPRILKLNGKAGWDYTIPCLRTQSNEESWWARIFAEGNIEPARNVMFHHCPLCGKVESSQRGKFQRFNLDTKVKCGFCFKTSSCYAWKCQCDELWHACEIHRSGYTAHSMQSKSHPAKPVKPNYVKPKGIKRVITEPCFRTRSAKRFKSQSRGEKRAGVTLEGPMSKTFWGRSSLGPVLAARFDDLHASAPSSA